MNDLDNEVIGAVSIYVDEPKCYHARVRVDGRLRWTRRKLDTFTDAITYGERLIARYETLKTIWKEEL